MCVCMCVDLVILFLYIYCRNITAETKPIDKLNGSSNLYILVSEDSCHMTSHACHMM